MKEEQLRSVLQERIPHFVPEWHYPLEQDAATILVDSFLPQLAQSWTRVEQLPMLWRQFSASLLPQTMPQATPAQTFLMIQLIEQAVSDVIVPAKTRWRAHDNENVTFELLEPFPATRSRVRTLLYGDDQLTTETGEPLPKPAVYVAAGRLLCGEQGMSLLFTWPLGAPPVTFSHWNGETWQAMTLERKSEQVVKLTWGANTVPKTIMDEEGYWLKIERQADEPGEVVEELSFSLPRRWSYTQWNAVKFDERWTSGTPFQPFLRFTVEGDQFYLTHRQLFRAVAATIELEWDIEWIEEAFRTVDEPKRQWKWIMKASEFAEVQPSYIELERISISFWNGGSWEELIIDGAATLFQMNGTAREIRTIQFEIPARWQSLLLNGEESVWLRFKVERVTPLGGQYPVYRTPLIHQLQMKLVDDVQLPVQTLIVERDGQCERSLLPVSLFQTECTLNSRQLFFSLTHEPLIEQITLFCQWSQLLIEPVQRFRCYIKTDEQWLETTMQDETEGGTSDGRFIIQVPKVWNAVSLFNECAYWFKITYESERPLRLRHYWLNAAIVVQQKTIEGEYVSLTYRQDEAIGYLQRTPIIAATVFIDETKTLTEVERQRLIEEGRTLELGEGTKRKVFVRWERVTEFHQTSFHHRHYKLNERTGELQFRHHLLLKEQRFEPVYVQYEQSMLEEGNVEAENIAQAEQIIPFVEQVSQPFAAFGGASWSSEQLIATPLMTDAEITRAILYRFPSLAEVKLIRDEAAILVVCRSRIDDAQQYELRFLTPHIKQFLLEETALSYLGEQEMIIVAPERCYVHVHSSLQLTGASLPFEVEQRLTKRLKSAFSGAINYTVTEMELKQLFFQEEAVERIRYLYVVIELAISGRQLNLSQLQQLSHFSLYDGQHTFQFERG